MDHLIVNAVLATPLATVDLVTGSPSPAATALLSRLRGAGVTLFVTAVTPAEVEAAQQWRARVGSEIDVRLLSPGRLYWPAGSRHPFLGERLSSSALSTFVGALRDSLGQDAAGLRIEHDDAEAFIALVGDRAPGPDLVDSLWRAGNIGDMALTFHPERPLQTHWSAGEAWTVLAPAVPSVTWSEAVTAVECFPRGRVILLESPRDAEHDIAVGLRRRFCEGDKEPAAPLGVLDPGAQEPSLPKDLLFAPRIGAPSEIHFVAEWSKENSSYVRERYWEATQRATRHRREAEALLSALPERYARAGQLAALSHKVGGERLIDDFSGAICFSPGAYEFEVPRQTCAACEPLVEVLSAYFDETLEKMPFDRPLLKRRLFTNSLVLLRGEGYYANLKQIPPWRRADDLVAEADALSEVIRGLEQHPPVLDAAVHACLTGGPETLLAWKLLLGALDQARNLGLILLSVGLHIWRLSDRVEADPVFVRAAGVLVDAYFRVMLGDTEIRGTELLRDVRGAVEQAATELRSLSRQEPERARGSTWYEPDEVIRGWREGDNPYENLLVGMLAAATVEATTPTAALGVYWGGVELPFAARAAAEAQGKEFRVRGFLSQGHYSRSSDPVNDVYCDLYTGQFEPFTRLREQGISRIALLDDNSLSGRTLESARDLLLTAGQEQVDTWIVQFSGERREGQMRMNRGGIVHPAYLTTRLRGYLGETPYARSYSRTDYKSPVGVFNTARSRILRYLHNNGFASIYEREGF
jgi:hypothetical protein